MAFARARTAGAFAAALLAAAASASAQDCGLIGDMNGDGAINIVDAVTLVRATLDPAMVQTPPTGCPTKGDMNMDGKHNIVDAVQLIQQMLAPPSSGNEDDEDEDDMQQPLPGAPTTVPKGGTLTSDPHFVGFNGAKYDVTGTSGKYYSIISDSGLAINAKFETAWTTGAAKVGGGADFATVVAKGTWVTEVAVVVPGHSIVVSAKPAPGVGAECDGAECFAAGSLVVDGTAAAYYGAVQVGDWGRVDSTADGVTITATDLEVTVKIAGPQVEWGIPAAEAPLYSHCNLALNQFEPSDHAHGLLGYTARASAGIAAVDDDGAGVLEGSVSEYEVAAITATDFTYSQF